MKSGLCPDFYFEEIAVILWLNNEKEEQKTRSRYAYLGLVCVYKSCLPEDFALAADSILERFDWWLVGDNAIQTRIVGKFEIMTGIKLGMVGQ